VQSKRQGSQDEEDAIGDLGRALQLHGLDGKVKVALEQAKAKRLFHIAKEKQMFAGALNEGDLYEPVPSEQAIKEAAEFGVDLRDPRVKAAIRHMQKHLPKNVEELVYEKQNMEKWEKFSKICGLIVFLVSLSFAMFHLLMRYVALSAKKPDQVHIEL